MYHAHKMSCPKYTIHVTSSIYVQSASLTTHKKSDCLVNYHSANLCNCLQQLRSTIRQSMVSFFPHFSQKTCKCCQSLFYHILLEKWNVLCIYPFVHYTLPIRSWLTHPIWSQSTYWGTFADHIWLNPYKLPYHIGLSKHHNCYRNVQTSICHHNETDDQLYNMLEKYWTLLAGLQTC